MVGKVKSVLRVGDDATVDTPMHARLQPHRKYFEKHVAELRSATDAAIVAHKKQLIDRQMLVERLSNMAIELFARACVLSRSQRMIRERGLEAIERELNLCDLFCVQSGRRFKEQRENLQSPQDATRRAIAEDLRRAGGAFVADSVLEVPLHVRREPQVPMRIVDDEVVTAR